MSLSLLSFGTGTVITLRCRAGQVRLERSTSLPTSHSLGGIWTHISDLKLLTSVHWGSQSGRPPFFLEHSNFSLVSTSWFLLFLLGCRSLPDWFSQEGRAKEPGWGPFPMSQFQGMWVPWTIPFIEGASVPVLKTGDSPGSSLAAGKSVLLNEIIYRLEAAEGSGSCRSFWKWLPPSSAPPSLPQAESVTEWAATLPGHSIHQAQGEWE